MKPFVYAQIKLILDRCFHRRIVQEVEKDELERTIAKCTAVQGANCAASEASMAHRMILASFGLVPRGLDICVKPLSDDQVADAVIRIIQAIEKRERRVSVASLTRYNLANAAAVWSASGGHPAWLLHLTYLADAVGKKLSIADITKRTQKVPQILSVDDAADNSVYSMGLETGHELQSEFFSFACQGFERPLFELIVVLLLADVRVFEAALQHSVD